MDVLIIATVAVDVALVAVGSESGAEGLAVGAVQAGEDLLVRFVSEWRWDRIGRGIG